MQAAEQEVFEELRSERLWRFAERMAGWVVYVSVAILLMGLVFAATTVLMDSVGPFGAPFSVSDDE